MNNKVFFNFLNWFKRFVSLKSLFNINIGDFIYKVVFIFNFGFFVIAVYISINYFHEFIYFINLDNINVFQYSSNDVCHCEYSLNDIVSCDKSFNKQLDFSNNSKFSKHNSGLIDFPNYKTGIKTDMYVPNMVSINNSDNSDRLCIIKYLEKYKSIKLDFNKMEKDLIFKNIDLNNKIYRLQEGMDCTSNIINEIIELYINDLFT